MKNDYLKINQDNYLKYFGNIAQMGLIKQYTINGGKGHQVRVSNVSTGAGLSYDVVIDRGMDISTCLLNGRPLSWLSRNGVTHPAYYNQSGSEKLRTFFGGLFTTCGLTHAGPPDDYNKEYEGQHGRISDEPAQKYSWDLFWKEKQLVIEQTGEVTQTKIFAENLLMRRKITSVFGKNKIFVETNIKNQGYKISPLMFLTHMNFGFPLLTKQSQLFVNYSDIIPRDEQAKKGMKRLFSFEEPQENYQEQVFFIEPVPDSHDLIRIMLSNNNTKDFLGMIIQYKRDSFTHLTLWKMLGYGDYVLGIEPGNCYPIGRELASKQTDLSFINPQEEKTFVFEISFYSDIDDYQKEQHQSNKL